MSKKLAQAKPLPGYAVDILTGFDQVLAVGLTGSHANKKVDRYSDLDLAVFVRDEIPSAERRKRRYESCGVEGFPYFDKDWEVCTDDGLTIDGTRCEIIWMAMPVITSFLEDLDRNFDADEFLPGGLLSTAPLLDPDGVIPAIKSLVPVYSEERAVYRIKKHLDHAHFSIYVLDWFSKAAFRDDHFSFFIHLREVVEDLVTCCFALNRRWLSDEKRVLDILGTFEMVPENVGGRLASIIMHTGGNAALDQSLENLKGLFRELAFIADAEHPNSGFPLDWN